MYAIYYIEVEGVVQRCSVKKGACNFIEKETLTQVFSCECCEIFKNTIFLQNTSGSYFWSGGKDKPIFINSPQKFIFDKGWLQSKLMRICIQVVQSQDKSLNLELKQFRNSSLEEFCKKCDLKNFIGNTCVEVPFLINAAQKMKFSIKDFFSKCDQIRSFFFTTINNNKFHHKILSKKSPIYNLIFFIYYCTTTE